MSSLLKIKHISSNVDVSIIVPVYNIDKYLSRCLKSIIEQENISVEVLLIDDGSTDNSGIICDDYARNDCRIKSIHQPNSGVSVARNLGISKASGEYIGFIDGDDWCAGDMFNTLLNCAKENHADIVMCDLIITDGKTTKKCRM